MTPDRLSPLRRYRVEVRAGITDLGGNALVPREPRIHDGHGVLLRIPPARRSSMRSSGSYASGITTGCTAQRFCPTAAVRRAEMAGFLSRALELPGDRHRLLHATTRAGKHEDNINRVAAAGVTEGCTRTNYCPTGVVTRGADGELPVARTRVCRLPTTTTSGDDDGTPHEGSINRLAAAGITIGCGGGQLLPGRHRSRGRRWPPSCIGPWATPTGRASTADAGRAARMRPPEGEQMVERAGVRVHPTAEVSPDAVIGPGTSIWNQAQVREDARIGAGCIIGKNVYVDAGVVVGDRVKIQNNVSLFRGVTVEDGVFVGPHVCFTNDRVPRAINRDGSPKTDDDWEVTPILVRSGAALGANSTILPGVTIGRWAMIGAGSVVTRDVADNELVAGNPARRLGSACACGQPLRDVDGEPFAGDCPACGTPSPS